MEYSDDPLATGSTEHSLIKNTPKPLDPPPIFTTNPTTGPKIKQRKQKRPRPIYAADENETDREISLPSSNTTSEAEETDHDATMETPRQERQRRHRRSSPPGFGFGEGPTILQREMAAQATLATNNAILSTVEILTAEVKQFKELLTSLNDTVATLKSQNADLKQGQYRMEQQIQRMGRLQRDPPRPNTTPEPASGTNTQPINNRRPQQQQPQGPLPHQAQATHQAQPQTQPPPQASTLENENTWAKVARKGNDKKETPPAPPKRTERTIVVHRRSDEVNEETDIHHMRDTINNILRHNKAPANLIISGIQWNRRGNLTLTTINKFTEEELAPHISSIRAQVEKFDKEVAAVGKQETWTKVIVHKVDTGRFPDNEVGMQSLKTELETFNEGLQLASTPRYLTRPEDRAEKAHSSCVIAMKDRTYLKRMLKYGTTIFGRQCKTEEYFSARPTDQCRLCQKFGHHYRRCQNLPVCGICADPHHETSTHSCLNCNSRHGCDHKPAKCVNCGGRHKANSSDCEYLQAIRNPQEPGNGTQTEGAANSTNTETMDEQL